MAVLLMVVGHGHSVFNAQPGTAPPAGEFFLARFAIIGAPTFVFLAGMALAFMAEKLRREGGERAVDQFFLIRGLILLVLDPTVVTWLWDGPPPHVFQVFYALGTSMLCLVLLRRLSNRWLLGLSLGFLVFGEALTFQFWEGTWTDAPPLVALLLAVGSYQSWMVLYPLFPWLSIMILGLVFGRHLISLRRAREPIEGPAIRRLLAWGGAALVIFGIVRGFNGYGNMRLLREDGSPVQWMTLSKFPPSLSYVALTLGLVAFFLAALFHYQRRTPKVWLNNPLLTFGQTSFFFYLTHWALLVALSKLTGLNQKAGPREAYAAALVAVIVLYPLCRLYRRYKTRHPGGWTRYF